MKERDILFSGPLVRALLAGTKTQTRRLMKPQPEPIPDDVERVKPYDDSGYWWLCDKARSMVSMHDAPCLGPYGYKGDRLWVRESFSLESAAEARDTFTYRADGACYERNGSKLYSKAPFTVPDNVVRWKPGIHMPRWASRITLEVTEVLVQRLQDISEEDAGAEGCPCLSCGKVLVSECRCASATADYRRDFAQLWDRINGAKAPWSSNPWVWAISFRRLP